jgi:hypothetical protein
MKKTGSKKSRDTVPWSRASVTNRLKNLSKWSSRDHIMTIWAKSIPTELNGFPANFQTRAGTAGSWHGAGHAGRPGLVSEQVTILLILTQTFPPFHCTAKKSKVKTKEDIKEQPTPRNLSATARRVLQCTVHAQLQLLGNIFRLFTPHLTSDIILTPNYVNNIILHLLWVLCTAVNVRNKN